MAAAGSNNWGLKSSKSLLAGTVLAVLVTARWLSIYPAVVRQLEIGSFVPVWLVASIVAASSILAVAVLADLDKHLHAREGQQLSFSRAFLKICLVLSPVVFTSGLHSRLLPADIARLALDPFQFFPLLLGSLWEGLTNMSYLQDMSYFVWVAFAAAPWLASGVIYVRLSCIGRLRSALALALTPIIVVATATAELALIIDWID
ncbi:MAG: hypothetical protein KGZ66_02185 [Selenomonadales bacterium]|nr:hypothetical protein [Selenomonadales bacterium]